VKPPPPAVRAKAKAPALHFACLAGGATAYEKLKKNHATSLEKNRAGEGVRRLHPAGLVQGI
jgi:hypothetical protein